MEFLEEKVMIAQTLEVAAIRMDKTCTTTLTSNAILKPHFEDDENRTEKISIGENYRVLISSW